MPLRRLAVVLLGLVIAIGAVASAAMTAEAKFGVVLVAPGQARIGHPVPVRIRAAEALPQSCDMRLLAIAPGVDRERALDAFISGGTTTVGPNGPIFHRLHPSAQLGFLMHPLRSDAMTWTATATFPRGGRWQIVVPNWCAEGYASPLPAVRIVTVR